MLKNLVIILLLAMLAADARDPLISAAWVACAMFWVIDVITIIVRWQGDRSRNKAWKGMGEL